MADAPGKAALSTKRLALLLGGLAMFGPFSIDTIFPAFPEMGAQLGADKIAMQQTISVYLIAYALTSVVHGPLSDAIGRRRVILGGLAVFTLASAGCAMSMDLGTLLMFRALQGLSAGVGLIVGRAVIRDVLHGHDAQRLMSQVSMIFGIALVFPILTLAILDMYPRQRGSASSLQAFTGLVSNAFIAGVLSPLLSHTGLHLALGAAVFTALGYGFWRWETQANALMPYCPPGEAPALEPTERL